MCVLHVSSLSHNPTPTTNIHVTKTPATPNPITTTVTTAPVCSGNSLQVYTGREQHNYYSSHTNICRTSIVMLYPLLAPLYIYCKLHTRGANQTTQDKCTKLYKMNESFLCFSGFAYVLNLLLLMFMQSCTVKRTCRRIYTLSMCKRSHLQRPSSYIIH